METIGICMIVKDAVRTIESCISSVRPYVDEINVYDTGSTDGTQPLVARIAKEPGARIRIEQGEWRDDFAWARNESFAMASASCSWLLWLDDDETMIHPSSLVYLSVLSRSVESVLIARERAWPEFFSCHEFHTRAVRQGRGWRWEGVAHEKLEAPTPSSAVAFTVANPHRLSVFEDLSLRRRLYKPKDASDVARDAFREYYIELLLHERNQAIAEGHLPKVTTLMLLAFGYFVRSDIGRAYEYAVEYIEHPDARAYSDVRIRVLSLCSECCRLSGNPDQAAQFSAAAQEELGQWRRAMRTDALEGLSSLGPDFFAIGLPAAFSSSRRLFVSPASVQG